MAEIRDELFYKQKNGYDTMSTQQRIDMEDYCRGYMAFLNEARTEREAVKIAIEMAEDKGFVEYVDGMKLAPGDKVYCNNRSKALMLAVIGRKSLEEGCVIAGAHVDSPRIDLKQNPLYESDELAYFKTHYYGGIKKYQWVTIPLELHGVVALKNGETIDVSIGHDPSDPAVCHNRPPAASRQGADEKDHGRGYHRRGPQYPHRQHPLRRRGQRQS